jgi:hypothetical protein
MTHLLPYSALFGCYLPLRRPKVSHRSPEHLTSELCQDAASPPLPQAFVSLVPHSGQPASPLLTHAIREIPHCHPIGASHHCHRPSCHRLHRFQCPRPHDATSSLSRAIPELVCRSPFLATGWSYLRRPLPPKPCHRVIFCDDR